MAFIPQVYQKMLSVLEGGQNSQRFADRLSMLKLCYAMWENRDNVKDSIVKISTTKAVGKLREDCLQKAYLSVKKRAGDAELGKLFLGGDANPWEGTYFALDVFDNATAAAMARNYMAAAMVDIQFLYNTYDFENKTNNLLHFAGVRLIGSKNYPETTGLTTDDIMKHQSLPTPVGMTKFATWKPPQQASIAEILTEWSEDRTEYSVYGNAQRLKMIDGVGRVKNGAQLAEYDKLIRTNDDHNMAEYHKKCFWQAIFSQVAKMKDYYGPEYKLELFNIRGEIVKKLNEIAGKTIGKPDDIWVSDGEISFITAEEIGRMLDHLNPYAIKPNPPQQPTESQKKVLMYTIQNPEILDNWTKFGFTLDQRQKGLVENCKKTKLEKSEDFRHVSDAVYGLQVQTQFSVILKLKSN